MLLKNMQGRLEPSLFYERDRYVCPSVDGAIQREECLVARIGFRVVDDAGLAAHELVEGNRTERLQRKPAGNIGQMLRVPLGSRDDMRRFVDLRISGAGCGKISSDRAGHSGHDPVGIRNVAQLVTQLVQLVSFALLGVCDSCRLNCDSGKSGHKLQ